VTSPSLDPQALRAAAAAIELPAQVWTSETDRTLAAIDGRALRRKLLRAVEERLGDDSLRVVEADNADRLFDALENALRERRFFAVVGAAANRLQAQALAYFEHKHRFNLAQTLSWPDADLCVMESRLAQAAPPRDYLSLKSAYDERYFLADCGGYDTFVQSQGRLLAEVRHHALVALARPRKGQRLLDLGCGRGELSYALSRGGASVLGLDYAESAIDIARRTFADVAPETLQFLCADAAAWKPTERFDTIVMADVVEHIDAKPLDALIEKAAQLLTPDGRLLIHTAPNLLHYRFVHRALRVQALAAGAWLPKNPRSFHEDLMHINEQTPKRLQRALTRHFPHVCVWAADEADPALTLRTPDGSGWRQAPFLYAVASRSRVDRAGLLTSLSQAALALPPALTVLHAEDAPRVLRRGERRTLRMTLRNDGTESLSSFAPTPVHFGVHWLYEDGGVAVWDGDRSRLPGRIAPASVFDTTLAFTAPTRPGRYRLHLALVQEHVAWHDEAPSPLPRFAIEVV
jgi:2-polyprenyl-3-methyl-5-hydroxy-6-metoxy-1,4-benzoquinol methylase